MIQKNHNSLFLPLKNLTRLCDKRDKKWERETTSLLLMICTDSSDQCIGFFLCQEALDLKEEQNLEGNGEGIFELISTEIVKFLR